MDNKPYKDYICPRCKHNVGFRQQFCTLCGLELNWNSENDITYGEYHLPKVISATTNPYSITLTGSDPKDVHPVAVVTC